MKTAPLKMMLITQSTVTRFLDVPNEVNITKLFFMFSYLRLSSNEWTKTLKVAV